MEMLEYPEQIEGKTVKSCIVLDSNDGERLAFVFTDETLAIIRGRSYYESEDTDVEITTDTLSLKDQAEIGIVTQEAYQATVEAQQRESKARQAAQEEVYDRREYERLKAKFG